MLRKILIAIVLGMCAFDAALHGLELFTGIVWPIFHGGDWRTLYNIVWMLYWGGATVLLAVALWKD